MNGNKWNRLSRGRLSRGSAADCKWSDQFDSSWFKFQKKIDLIFAIFSFSSFTIYFKICLYARHFDTLDCPHWIFWWYFTNSPKLWVNKFCPKTWLNFIEVSCIQIVLSKFCRIEKVPSKYTMWTIWCIKMSSAKAYFKMNWEETEWENSKHLFF